MTVAQETFLGKAAQYFENRSTGGEDRAYWSNVFNAENCREIAEHIAKLEAVAKEAAELFRSYEKIHTDKAAKIITMGKSKERDDRLNKADRNRMMAEKLETAIGE